MTGDTKKCTYLEGYIAILFAPINQLLKLSPGKWKMLIVRLILSLRADNYFHPVFPCYKNICFWWQYTLKQVKFITIYLQFILAFLTYGQIKLDSCLALKYISIFHWIFSLSVRNVFHTKHQAMWGKKKGQEAYNTQLTLTLMTFISTASSIPYKTTSSPVRQNRSWENPTPLSQNFTNLMVLVMKAKVQ